MEALTKIQSELKAPKGQYNSFGQYSYRSCEDILEAVKPLLLAHQCTLTLSDDIVLIGQYAFIKATAVLKSGTDVEQVSALARHAETRKGMDDSQITGATSSYARKYAVNGLFCIDDNKDADTDGGKGREVAPPTVPQAPKQPKASVATLSEKLHDKNKFQTIHDAIAKEVEANNYPLVPTVEELAKFIEERPTITKFAELVKTWVNVEADKGSAQ